MRLAIAHAEHFLDKQMNVSAAVGGRKNLRMCRPKLQSPTVEKIESYSTEAQLHVHIHIDYVAAITLWMCQSLAAEL